MINVTVTYLYRNNISENRKNNNYYYATPQTFFYTAGLSAYMYPYLHWIVDTLVQHSPLFDGRSEIQH